MVLLAGFFVLSTLYSMDIRLYQDTDLPFARALITSYPEDLLVPGNNLQTRLSETERYLVSKNYITQVCTINNEPAGFIVYSKEGVSTPFIENAMNYDWTKPMEMVLQGVVQILAVQSKYHRKGIGKALLIKALDEMKSKNINAVLVQTKGNNTASRALYEKFGFKLMFPVPSGCTGDILYRCRLT